MSEKAPSSTAAKGSEKKPAGDKGKPNANTPDNPFLPNSLFGSNEERLHAHVAIFLGIIIGLRFVGMFTNLDSVRSLKKCRK